ncbi:aminotransferase class I/II-fold pyridoxal phosphate-dependent enzyme [Bacillus suaedaesalsae]|uniref:Aminotransferase class I/II-fold pyridoxal phosphate-dependent enzyme n=1 Tax=Bacillus suaedaesalsae TaxID=2810349 RepID=A0ABS2DCN3_9BACI|nr:aminotransferase class I/II-fold pyridoxal phosphate-dependent enzyme [Bacillus suaedaesalsae]MBM6616223.1 aminotransferase class I/II-fold pyridoxal phosphate-dependent enzyme [Bacillus suaedaesalsae]
MNQKSTPLFDSLKSHVKKTPVSFHVPGHKSGNLFLEKGLEFYKDILSIDVTELSGLDDLHQPEEAILKAELLLSNHYGSKKSFFLVNGTTVGNLAMILSVCSVNDTVIVSRNCHKSIMNGLMLTGAKPVFVGPNFDTDLQIATYVSEQTFKEAINQYPKAKAIIITNPNYYGQTFDLTNIISYAHEKGIPVLVDEAHGAHFGIGEPFPKSAIASGADIVVQSAHKTLPAMTMGSYLHFQSDLVSLEQVKMYLKTMQSSSPSYPIMASLDLARAYIATFKKEKVVKLVDTIEKWKDELSTIPQINIVNSKDPNITQDPLKVIMQTKTSLSGYELQSLLEEEGIYTELADPLNVLCILPLEVKQLHTISETIKDVLSHLPVIQDKKSFPFHQITSDFPYSYWELKPKKTKWVTIEEGIEKLSAETIIPYPPGIPLLLYGERITHEHIRQMKRLKEMGAKFQGSNIIDKLNIIE